jgi:hypothetical protein
VNRPVKKNLANRLFSSLLTFLAFFAFFSSLSLLVPSTVQAIEGPKSCGAWEEEADVKCRCRKDQCRLSMFENWNFFDARFWDSSKPNATQYHCFDNGDTIDSKTAPYSYYSYDNYAEKLKLKTQPTDKFPPLAIDAYSMNISKQFVPEGSVCKVSDGIGYWYYPAYAEKVMGVSSNSVGAKCENPALVSNDLFGNPVSGVETFFGCVPASINGLVAFVLRLGLGFGTVVGVLIVLVNLIKIVSSSANPDAVTEARKKMLSGITSLVGLYLALTLLSIAGLQILDLGNMGGSLLRLFTGG